MNKIRQIGSLVVLITGLAFSVATTQYGGTAAQGNYTTADLQGCYLSQDSSFLHRYEFDGAGGVTSIYWNQVAGDLYEGGSYSISGDILQLDFEDDDTDATYTLVIDGDTIYLDSSGYDRSDQC